VQSYAESEQATSDGAEVARALGDALRSRREGLGLSLRAAGERAGISPAHLSEVERGRKEPSLAKLAALSRALETTPGELFLDLAIALGAAPPRPARHPLGFAPDPRDELAWVTQSLSDPDLRTVAAFGSYLVAQHKGGAQSWPR
jgi:transcriptional regulator with XRE-family HTH domain